MAQPQSFEHHTRRDPAFHFFIIPLLLLNFFFAIYTHLWWIVMSIVILAMAELFRSYAVKNQNRLIRLEEQLRLADLLPEDQLGLIDTLTVEQFVGLRFASDAEVAALAQRAVAENLNRKQIKQAIITWRPDNHRI